VSYPTYELPSGETLNVVTVWERTRYSAYVLQDPEAPVEWALTWTDGINEWVEWYEQSWHALARLAVVVAACDQDVFLVHAGDPAEFNEPGPAAFVAEAERFVSRTVHASSCAPGCDGADPVNHQV